MFYVLPPYKNKTCCFLFTGWLRCHVCSLSTGSRCWDHFWKPLLKLDPRDFFYMRHNNWQASLFLLWLGTHITHLLTVTPGHCWQDAEEVLKKKCWRSAYMANKTSKVENKEKAKLKTDWLLAAVWKLQRWGLFFMTQITQPIVFSGHFPHSWTLPWWSKERLGSLCDQGWNTVIKGYLHLLDSGGGTGSLKDMLRKESCLVIQGIKLCQKLRWHSDRKLCICCTY